jgi:hypothetical protein
MNLILAVLVGHVAGTHTATWGMYKDAPHEGFTVPKYVRSIVLAGAIGVVVYLVTGLELRDPGQLAVFFGLTYAIERLTLELWKGFIREEDQSKYFIPMQFHILGRVVHSRALRWSVLAAVVALLLLIGYGVHRLQATDHGIPQWVLLATIGSLGGWLTAFGGAWKDAPIEGFETLKFFRSPLISFFWAVLLSRFTGDILLISLAAAGYSVATIETYKTFFFPSKPRGKFAGKPVLYPEMLERRQYFVPVYAAIWVGIIGLFVAAFLSGSPR